MSTLGKDGVVACRAQAHWLRSEGLDPKHAAYVTRLHTNELINKSDSR